MFNVLVAPGEVFDEIKSAAPMLGNWLVPLALLCVVAATYVFVVFSQPTILQQVRDRQDREFEKRVEQGRMTREQADQAKQFMERLGPKITMISGSIGAVGGNAAMLFGTALVLWGVGVKICKGRFGYMKAVEIAGFGAMLDALGTVVAMFLAVIFGSMLATPGPVLLVGEIDPANKLHLALSTLNVFSLWRLYVLSVGVARCSGASFTWAVVPLFVIWLLIRAGSVLTGLASGGM